MIYARSPTLCNSVSNSPRLYCNRAQRYHQHTASQRKWADQDDAQLPFQNHWVCHLFMNFVCEENDGVRAPRIVRGLYILCAAAGFGTRRFESKASFPQVPPFLSRIDFTLA